MSDGFERQLSEHLQREAGQVSSFPRQLSARIQDRIAGRTFSLFQQLMLAGALVVFVGLLAVGIAHLKGLSQVNPAHPKPSPSVAVTPSVTRSVNEFGCQVVSDSEFSGGTSITDGSITRVQPGNHESDGYDRVTFEFASALPSYSISRSSSQQFMLDPIGTPVTVAGSESVLVTFTGTPTIGASVPPDQTPNYQAVREIRRISGGFEGVTKYAIGLRLAPCVKVTELTNPARLVIDFGTTPPSAPSASYQFRTADMSFVDAQHGFAVGTACSQTLGKCGFTAIARTSDGGLTWHDTPAQIGSPVDLHGIHFQTPTLGWVYGQALYETRDGGNSWQQVVNLPVDSIASSSNHAWAIVRDCSSSCTLRLYVSNLTTGGWALASIQPGLTTGSGQIVMVDDSTGWVLGYGPSGSSLTSELFVTHDGGTAWQPLVKPCADATSLDDQMAALPDGSLWIICGGQSAAGSEEKQLITSADGGVHWSFPPNLSLSGHVSQFTLVSGTSGWAAFNQGQAYVTTDGGQHWTAAGSRGLPADGAGAGYQGLQFVGPQGWVANGAMLYRSSDGGAHWTGTPFVMVSL